MKKASPLKYAMKSVDSLMANERNARTHTQKQIDKIAASIKEFGFISPAIIDKDGVLVAGHGRLEAAKQIGLTEIPCITADHLTPAQLRAYMLADNRIQLDAGWDEEMLKVELQELTAADFDMTFTGFEESEINKIFLETNNQNFIEDNIEFGIFLTFENEKTQQDFYEELTQRGVKCKIMN